MLWRFYFLTALLGAACSVLHAQASPDCPTHPTSLQAMRHCYRPLLVFAPSGRDPRLARQQAALDQTADDMMDRNVLLLPLLSARGTYSPPLDSPYDVLPASESLALRRRFHVDPASFRVILIGEDGSVKLESSAPVSVEKLNSLIDSMPSRKQEMQRPHTN